MIQHQISRDQSIYSRTEVVNFEIASGSNLFFHHATKLSIKKKTEMNFSFKGLQNQTEAKRK